MVDKACDLNRHDAQAAKRTAALLFRELFPSLSLSARYLCLSSVLIS